MSKKVVMKNDSVDTRWGLLDAGFWLPGDYTDDHDTDYPFTIGDSFTIVEVKDTED